MFDIIKRNGSLRTNIFKPGGCVMVGCVMYA